MGQMVEMNTTLRHLLFLLEYCMVTGYDWWDVLLHVQPTMVHNLVERLHEEYMRQNQALQQVRRSRGGGQGSPGGHVTELMRPGGPWVNISLLKVPEESVLL